MPSLQMWEKQSTIGEFTWLVTATNATLTDLLHEACASFDEGISISDQTAAFIKAQGERATTRDADREMAGYFFDAASATCEALAT